MLRCRCWVQRLSRSFRESVTLPVDARICLSRSKQRDSEAEQSRAALKSDTVYTVCLVSVGVKFVLLSRAAAAGSIRCNGIVRFSSTPISAKNHGEWQYEKIEFYRGKRSYAGFDLSAISQRAFLIQV